MHTAMMIWMILNIQIIGQHAVVKPTRFFRRKHYESFEKSDYIFLRCRKPRNVRLRIVLQHSSSCVHFDRSPSSRVWIKSLLPVCHYHVNRGTQASFFFFLIYPACKRIWNIYDRHGVGKFVFHSRRYSFVSRGRRPAKLFCEKIP